MIILLLLILLSVLLVTGGAVGVILKKDLEEVEDAGKFESYFPAILNSKF